MTLWGQEGSAVLPAGPARPVYLLWTEALSLLHPPASAACAWTLGWTAWACLG